MSGKAQIEGLLAIINASARDAMAEYERQGDYVPTSDSKDVHPLDTAEDCLKLKKAIRQLEGACDQLCCTLAPPAHTIVNRGQNLDWVCLLIVIQARIADVLAEHPGGLHVQEVSKVVGIEAGKLSRVLHVLATKGTFSEVESDVFANNRLSLILLSSNNISDLTYCHTTLGPQSAIALYDNLTNTESAASYELTKAPFIQAVGGQGEQGTFFSWLKAHPKERATFGKAMIGLGSVMGSLAILHHYPWSSKRTVCDVGSGVGAFALPLARMFPQVRVTLLDLPDTINQAKEVWNKSFCEAVTSGQVELTPGDFFQEIPTKGHDVYYLRNIMHNWPDEPAMAILRTVRAAMAPNSSLLIHEYVLQQLNRTQNDGDLQGMGMDIAPEPMLPNYGAGVARAYYQDITMLLTFNSKERTLTEFTNMGAALGLKLVHVYDMAEANVLEFQIANEGK